ncbi:MAG: hypothetical protein V4773_11955 [Verrucomicrobiota bacterium]
MELTFDFSELEKKARRIGASADQVPYALARSLNDAAEVTRSYLISSTWPSSVVVRNQSFLKAALTTKGARATKENQSVEIYDRLNRASLDEHAEGGVKTPRGDNLAIGGRNVRRGARGVVASQRPKVLKNAFRKGDVIYQRVGKNKLKLMYVLKPSAKIKKDVPFHEDFARVMKSEIVKALPKNVAIAMRTAR